MGYRRIRDKITALVLAAAMVASQAPLFPAFAQDEFDPMPDTGVESTIDIEAPAETPEGTEETGEEPYLLPGLGGGEWKDPDATPAAIALPDDISPVVVSGLEDTVTPAAVSVSTPAAFSEPDAPLTPGAVTLPEDAEEGGGEEPFSGFGLMAPGATGPAVALLSAPAATAIPVVAGPSVTSSAELTLESGMDPVSLSMVIPSAGPYVIDFDPVTGGDSYISVSGAVLSPSGDRVSDFYYSGSAYQYYFNAASAGTYTFNVENVYMDDEGSASVALRSWKTISAPGFSVEEEEFDAPFQLRFINIPAGADVYYYISSGRGWEEP